MKTMKISEGTDAQLERLKRKWKMRNKDMVIKRLLDDQNELAVLRGQSKGAIQTGEIAERSLDDELENGTDFCYDCLNLPRCVEAICHDKHYEPPQCFKPKPSCVFKSVRKEDQKIECAKDFARMGKIHIVSEEFCSKCWDRKQAMLKKGKDQTLQIQTPASPVSQKPNSEDRTIECNHNGYSIYPIKTAQDLLNIPCIKDMNLKCENRGCTEKVERLMKLLG